MKTLRGLLLSSLSVFLISSLARAGSVYNGYLFQGVNSSTIAYVASVNTLGVPQGPKNLSAQITYSSAPLVTDTFNDGVASTGAVTVLSNSNLSGAQGTDSVTLTTAAIPSFATINLNGQILRPNLNFTIDVNYSSNTAVSIVSGVNAISSLLGITASTSSASTVQFTCAVPGAYCNSYPLSVNTSSMTVASAKFTGGQDTATLTVDGVTLMAGRDWAVGGSAGTTATNLANAIGSNSFLGPLLSTAVSSTKITLTAKSVGTATDYPYSVNNSSLTILTPNLTGGANSSYALGGTTLAIPNHGFYVGEALLYTAAKAIKPLVTGTTYYAAPVNSSSLALATTSTGSFAGNYIVWTSSTNTGGNTSTIKNLALAGTAGYTWQASNDGVNWANLSVSSITFASPYTAGSQLWDFGAFDYAYLRLNAMGPTQGGVYLSVPLNGKD